MIKISSELKKVIDCITYKDLERACTVSDGRVLSMVRSITDPTKKIGRIAALALFGRIHNYIYDKELNDITYSFNKDLLIPNIYDKLVKLEKEIRVKFNNKYMDFYNYYNKRMELTYDDLEFPEWDESILESYDITISSLMNLSKEQLMNESPEFKKFVMESDAYNNYKYIGSFNDSMLNFKAEYKFIKDDFYKRKERYLKFRSLMLEFKDKTIFSYLDKDTLSNNEFKEHFSSMIRKISDCYEDFTNILPCGIHVKFRYYYGNFPNWIKETYNINISNPDNKSSEYPFLDDNSALIALQLKGTGVFEKLLKVTRTGISFTSAGLSKYWYDCTKDIANNLKIDCELYPFYPYREYK